MKTGWHVLAATPLLRIGTASAVLIGGVADAPTARDSAAQACLREASGHADLTISRRPSGRPRLAPPYPELGVTLSHRDGLLLAAFSPEAQIGADLEPDTAEFEPHRLAADHFGAAEAAAIVRLPAADARDRFLRLWVAKEAALKLTGRGIYDGLDQPELAQHLGRLAVDGAEIAIAPSPRLPGMLLAVRRVSLPQGPAIYCALAVRRA